MSQKVKEISEIPVEIVTPSKTSPQQTKTFSSYRSTNPRASPRGNERNGGQDIFFQQPVSLKSDKSTAARVSPCGNGREVRQEQNQRTQPVTTSPLAPNPQSETVNTIMNTYTSVNVNMNTNMNININHDQSSAIQQKTSTKPECRDSIRTYDDSDEQSTEDTVTHETSQDHNDEENEPLLQEYYGKSKVYRRRWYVLAVFSLAAMIQGGGWGTWGPITQSAKAVFSWSNGIIALQPLWGNLAAILTQVPVIWVMDVKGLRISMLISVTFLSAGFGIRCVSSEPHLATWLINIGQTLIGVGGCFPFSGVSLVAATWFPPNQRATATSVASVFAYLGVAASFIVGPEVVPAPPNVTGIVTSSDSHATILNTSNLTDAYDLRKQSQGIMRLLYYEAGAMAVLLVLVLLYFPARPPHPPSRTAALPRTEFSKGLPALIRNKRFCILAAAYCLPIGAYGGLGAILDIDLNPTGISQTTAGWIGFYGTVGGCVSGLIFSRLADMFMRRLKLLLLLLFVGAALSCSWFCLLVLKYIPFSLPSIYVSSVLIGVFINGSIPLFYEAACEVSYPVAEGVTTGVLALLNNIVGIIFFALLLVPGIGVVWMNWTLLGCVLVAIPLLLSLKQHYARIDIDTEISVPEPQPSSVQTSVQHTYSSLCPEDSATHK